MFSFVAGAVRRNSMVYLAMVADQAAKLRVPAADFTLWHQGKWLDAEGRDWDLAGLAVAKQPLEQMIAVGVWGDVLCVGSEPLVWLRDRELSVMNPPGAVQISFADIELRLSAPGAHTAVFPARSTPSFLPYQEVT